MKHLSSILILLALSQEVHGNNGGLRRRQKEQKTGLTQQPIVAQPSAVPTSSPSYDPSISSSAVPSIGDTSTDAPSLDQAYSLSQTPTELYYDPTTSAMPSDSHQQTWMPSSSPSIHTSSSPTPAPSLTPTTQVPSEMPTTFPLVYESFSGGDTQAGRNFHIKMRYGDSTSQIAWHLFEGFGSAKIEFYSVDFGTLVHSNTAVVTTFQNMPSGVYTLVIADIASGIHQVTISKIVDGGDDILLWENDGDFGFIIEQVFYVS